MCVVLLSEIGVVEVVMAQLVVEGGDGQGLTTCPGKIMARRQARDVLDKDATSTVFLIISGSNFSYCNVSVRKFIIITKSS